MLIKCPECGKEISDKSSCCINCGCPIEKIVQLSDDKCPICGGDNPHINKDGRDTCSICGYVFNYDKYRKENPSWNYGNENQVHCPYCQSTNVKKISDLSKAANILFTGVYSIAENSKEWYCNNCNSKF